MTGVGARRQWGARRRRVLVAAAAGLALLASLAGCADDGATPDGAAPAEDVSSPLADCADLSSPPAQAGDGGGIKDEAPLPALSLPCFTGGEEVALDELRGPAVVNLWASWCGPCREELPVLQDFADQHAGQVHVVGVITEDARAAAASFATEFGVTFPGLYDRQGLVRAQLSAIGLPVTLFLDTDGQVVHQRVAPLDADELAQLAADHLGVAS